MKKYLIIAGALVIMAAFAGCGKDDSEGDVTSTEATPTDAEIEKVNIEVLDNDVLTLTYRGYSFENEGMLFSVKNKTPENIDVYFADVKINGETLQPLVGTDVAAGENEEDVLFIECENEVLFLNGILAVDDEDGNTIGSYEIANVCLSEDEVATTEEYYDYKDGGVVVLENDDIIVSYIGIDSDEPGLVFEIYNKTDELIQATFNYILVNGSEEEPSYVVEIMSSSFATLIADVSNPEDITELTAEIYISDYDDNDIATYDIEGVSLK